MYSQNQYKGASTESSDHVLMIDISPIVQAVDQYIEDIQMFLLNMAFISSSEVKNIYFS